MSTYLLTTKAGTIHTGSSFIKCLQAYIEHCQGDFNPSPVYTVEEVAHNLNSLDGSTVSHIRWVVVPERDEDNTSLLQEDCLLYISDNCSLDWATEMVRKLTYVREQKLNSRSYHYYAANQEGWAVGRTVDECLSEFYAEHRR